MITITKYRLLVDSTYIEFLNSELAQTFKTQNNILSEIEEIEEVRDDKPALYTSIEQKIANAQQFGNQLILEFGRENLLLGFNTNQVKAVIVKCSSIMSMLQSGSLYTCLDELSNMTPDENITQARIDAFKLKIQKYLGLI